MSLTPKQMRRIMPTVPGAFGNLNQFSSGITKDYFSRPMITGKTARSKERMDYAIKNNLKYANGKKLREGNRFLDAEEQSVQ